MAERQRWASEAWSKVKEGSLSKLGWPDRAKLLNAARRNRKEVMGKLNFLANASGDPATKAKARAIANYIKKQLDKEA